MLNVNSNVLSVGLESTVIFRFHLHRNTNALKYYCITKVQQQYTTVTAN